MRLIVPRRLFEVQPGDGGACRFIATTPIRTGLLGAWLNRWELDATRQRVREEGQNPKRLLERDAPERG